jgi:hypothetical protein
MLPYSCAISYEDLQLEVTCQVTAEPGSRDSAPDYCIEDLELDSCCYGEGHGKFEGEPVPKRVEDDVAQRIQDDDAVADAIWESWRNREK